MRSTPRLAVGAAIFLSALGNSFSAAKTPPINVVVVAVTQFDDPSWENPLLSSSIQAASDEIVKYFGATFPSATIRVLQTADETKRENIREALEVDLRDQGSHTLNLVFFLSHGISVEGGTADYPTDLLLVTSDTSKQRPRKKGILAGANLVGWFQQLPEGSVVLAFVDSCFSGALESIDVALDAKLKALNGLHMMVMTSGAASEVTYQAAFTRALLSLWQSSSSSGLCTQFEDFALREVMEKLLGFEFKVAEGHPQVVVDFSGSLCAESFAENRGLLLFYNGSQRDAAYRIAADGREEREGIVRKKRASLLRLNRRRYTVEIHEGAKRKTRPVDLAARGFATIMLGVSDISELDRPYRKLSVAARRIAIGAEDERLIAHVADVVSGASELLEVARAFDSSISTSRASENFLYPQPYAESAANVAILEGDYLRAARLLKSAAADADPEHEVILGQRSYYAFAAAGRPRWAREVQNANQLDLGDCEKCVQAAEQVSLNPVVRTLVRLLQAKPLRWRPEPLRHYQTVHAEHLLVSTVADLLQNLRVIPDSS